MNQIIEAFSANKKWSKIVGILFIVNFVLQVLGSFIPEEGASVTMMFSAIVLTVLIGIFLYLIPGLSLVKYAGLIKSVEENQVDPITGLEDACEQQAKFFKYLGVLSLIIIILTVIGVIIAIVVPFIMR